MKMTISEASELTEDCFHLFLDAGYNGLIDDAMGFIDKNEERRAHFMTYISEIHSWYNGLSADFSTEELETYFNSASYNVQLGWIVHIHHRASMLLRNLNQEAVIDFPTESAAIAKLIGDSRAFYHRLEE